MIYLDNAATSFPKPPSVIRETLSCIESYCGNPGRGSHRLAMASAEKIYACRERIASFFGGKSPERVVFTMNTTMAINTVIKGTLHAGDHVLLSDLEHNAVYRPIWRMAEEGRITYDVFRSFARDEIPRAEHILPEIERRIRPNTRMLLCTHASNICSAQMPLREIGDLCRSRGILFVVDAAQSAGHLPISVEKMKIDALCAPGHKGLLGLQGSGFLILSDAIEPEALMEGGNGLYSLEGRMPRELPERLESGTLPTPSIVGLYEGIQAVSEIGVERIGEKITEWNRRLQGKLMRIPRIRVLAPHLHGSILLFASDFMPSEVLGRELDRRGICVRCGFHCAALAHQTLQTAGDGAVRVSPGFWNTEEEIDAFADALREILRGR